ncbi:hypothetical protein Tco_0934065 [Tanacetum coccineum]
MRDTIHSRDIDQRSGTLGGPYRRYRSFVEEGSPLNGYMAWFTSQWKWLADIVSEDCIIHLIGPSRGAYVDFRAEAQLFVGMDRSDDGIVQAGSRVDDLSSVRVVSNPYSDRQDSVCCMLTVLPDEWMRLEVGEGRLGKNQKARLCQKLTAALDVGRQEVRFLVVVLSKHALETPEFLHVRLGVLECARRRSSVACFTDEITTSLTDSLIFQSISYDSINSTICSLIILGQSIVSNLWIRFPFLSSGSRRVVVVIGAAVVVVVVGRGQ